MHLYKCICTHNPEGYANEINAVGGIHNKISVYDTGLDWIGWS